MPEQTLAQAIKAKYPGKYDAWSDAALETSIKEKFPGKYDAWPTTQSIEAKPSEQPPIPGVGSERRVIEPSLKRTPGEARWEGFKSGAVDAAKELGGNAYRSALSFVDKPAWDIATLLGYKPTEQEQTAYNAMIAPPQTTAGKVGAAVPLTAGALLGAAEVGVLPTLAGLATGYVGGKVSRKAADIALPDDMDPAKREAAMSLAEFGGMTVGGAAGTKSVLSPTGQRVITSVGKATQGTLQERVASASLSALAGHEVGGPKGAAAGGVFGAIFPGAVVKRPRSFFTDWAKGVLTDAAEKAKAPSAPKAQPSVLEQRTAWIEAGNKAATEAKSVERLMPTEAANYKKTLEKARDAHVANGGDVPQPVAEQLTRVSQELAKPRLQKTAAAVQETLDAYGPNGLAGRVELVPDAVAKRDYISTQKSLNAYVEAGEQPPTGLVELFDRLRERVVATNKAVSAEAYDSATAALVDAAAQGPQAYAKALQSLPKQTRALLQNVDAELLNTLQSRAKNAGGTLGKPADDPWFTLMNDVLGEWARPESVEVPVESPGGSATVPSSVDVVRVPGAAVSVPAQAPAPASASATTPATASAPTQATAPATANSASARAARRGGSVLGYSTELPRQHNAQTLSAAARMLQLAHDITAAREANPRAFTKGTAQYAMKDSALDASLAEFERLARLFAGRGKLSSFASTRENIPNVGTVNGWISNATELKLTPRMKQLLGVETPKKD